MEGRGRKPHRGSVEVQRALLGQAEHCLNQVWWVLTHVAVLDVYPGLLRAQRGAQQGCQGLHSRQQGHRSANHLGGRGPSAPLMRCIRRCRSPTLGSADSECTVRWLSCARFCVAPGALGSSPGSSAGGRRPSFLPPNIPQPPRPQADPIMGARILILKNKPHGR